VSKAEVKALLIAAFVGPEVDGDIEVLCNRIRNISRMLLDAKSHQGDLPSGISDFETGVLCLENVKEFLDLLDLSKLGNVAGWLNVAAVLLEEEIALSDFETLKLSDLPRGFVDAVESILNTLGNHEMGDWTGLRMIWEDDPQDQARFAAKQAEAERVARIEYADSSGERSDKAELTHRLERIHSLEDELHNLRLVVLDYDRKIHERDEQIGDMEAYISSENRSSLQQIKDVLTEMACMIADDKVSPTKKPRKSMQPTMDPAPKVNPKPKEKPTNKRK
jgi:hypothetical protein